jgi:RHS repeat-associated protein
MHYLPYGEEWIDQQSTSWNAPYTFTGKIKDAETGYNYFGARYYDSKLSVWLSVDPLSDKYPSLSPYTYCANNPIMMVDPDGRMILVLCYTSGHMGLHVYKGNGRLVSFKNGVEGDDYFPSKDSYEGKVVTCLDFLKNSKNKLINQRFNDLMISTKKHEITKERYTDFNCIREENETDANTKGVGSNSSTNFLPDFKTEYGDGATWFAAAVLAHELLGHAWEIDQGIFDKTKCTDEGIPFMEITAINIQDIVIVTLHGKPRSLYEGKNCLGQIVSLKIPIKYINHYFSGATTY